MIILLSSSTISLIISFILFVYNGANCVNCPEYSYGILNKGCIAWGLNWYHNQVPNTTEISTNGSGAISIFGNIWNLNASVTYICFMPRPGHDFIVNNAKMETSNNCWNWFYIVAIISGAVGLGLLVLSTMSVIYEHVHSTNTKEKFSLNPTNI